MKKLLFIVLFFITALFGNSATVTLNMHGDFNKYKHFGFFIDTDNNPNTGYSNWKIKGADFYLQENGLYRYPKGAKGWKWNKVNSNRSITHTTTVMKGKISLDLLQANTIKYNAFVSDANWKNSVILDIKSVNLNLSTKNYNKKYVVAKNGNDNAIGDEKHPFKTIQKALDLAQAGNLIYVKAGTYYERLKIKNSGKPNLPITIKAQKTADGKRLVTLFGGDRVSSHWKIADEISPLVYKTQDIPYHSFAVTVQKDGKIKDIPKLYAQQNEAFFTNRKYDYKNVLAYEPNRLEKGPFTNLLVNYWDGIEALYAYEPSTHTTYIRFRNGENPNNMTIYSSPGSNTFFGKNFDPSHQGAVVTIANKSHIIIEGFNIDGAQDGVLIYGKNATNNIIEDNEITNGQRRVLIAQNASNNIIRNNNMHMRLLSKQFRPGAWLSQHKHEINDNYSNQDRKKIAVAEHYYNVYKHEVGASTGSPQDDCGVNFIYPGNNNRIYKNEIYDTLGGVFGLLSSGNKIYIHDNLMHHISSVTTHIAELDQGEYFIYNNKMYDVQIGIRVQLMLDYAHRKYLAKKVHFYNNIIYNPLFLGVNFYVYRTKSDHDYQNEREYHPNLKFDNNILIGGRVVLGLRKNIGTKTDLRNNIFSNIKMEIRKDQSLGVVKNNWVHTIEPSKYLFNSSNTMSNSPRWELAKIPTHIPEIN